MKSLLYINWSILAVYLLYFVYMNFSADSSGMDAAGRGMAKGFAFVGIIAVIVLALLNLINVKFVRYLILVLCCIPVLMTARQITREWRIKKQVRKGLQSEQYFDTPALKALAKAIDNNNLIEFQSLLQSEKPNVNTSGTGNISLIGIAVNKANYMRDSSSLGIVRSLLEYGADPELETAGRSSILAEIAAYCPFEIFSLLLQHGADPNGKDKNGVAVLYKLVKDQYTIDNRKVKMLLEDYQADSNIAFGEEGWTLNFSVLLFAASARHWELCKMLIDHGADTKFKPPSGLDYRAYLESAMEDYRSQDSIPKNFTELFKALN